MDKDISDRIWVTRYVMIIGIVILHLPPYQPLSQVGVSGFDYVKAFFTYGVFRTTVPVLTVMSGFLIFSSSLPLNPRKLLSKKIKSLLIPLIFWNLPLVIVVFFIQKYSILDHNFSAQLFPFETFNWLNSTVGLFANGPINYPLNFIRDLFVITLLSPLLWQMINRFPYIGLVILLIVYYFNLDGNLILRNSMLVSFYIGALAACHKWDLTLLDKYAVLLVGLLLLICAMLVIFKIDNRELFRLVSPFIVWPSMSLIMRSSFKGILLKYADNSFFTFLSHAPIILVIWLIFQKYFPLAPYFVYWFFAPVITVILTVLINKSVKKIMPRFHAFILGGR